MGHEFTSLVLALLQVGGHPSKATAELIEAVQDLDAEYHFETYFSLSCQNCPDVVQALNLMSVLNPKISHVAIDGALFQDEVDERKVMAVPTVFMNGELFDSGRMTLEQIVGKLDTSSAERAAEAIEGKAPFEVLVVGGGPAGACTAPRSGPGGRGGALVQDGVGERKVMAVPTVFMNGGLFDAGRMTLEQIVGKLDTSSAERAAEAIEGKDPFEVLVVGGGPAGASSAIYAARKGIRTGVVAERFGGQVLDTMAIENFISVPYTEGPKLVAALEQHVKDYDVDVMDLQQIGRDHV